MKPLDHPAVLHIKNLYPHQEKSASLLTKYTLETMTAAKKKPESRAAVMRLEMTILGPIGNACTSTILVNNRSGHGDSVRAFKTNGDENNF